MSMTLRDLEKLVKDAFEQGFNYDTPIEGLDLVTDEVFVVDCGDAIAVNGSTNQYDRIVFYVNLVMEEREEPK